MPRSSQVRTLIGGAGHADSRQLALGPPTVVGRPLVMVEAVPPAVGVGHHRLEPHAVAGMADEPGVADQLQRLDRRRRGRSSAARPRNSGPSAPRPRRRGATPAGCSSPRGPAGPASAALTTRAVGAADCRAVSSTAVAAAQATAVTTARLHLVRTAPSIARVRIHALRRGRHLARTGSAPALPEEHDGTHDDLWIDGGGGSFERGDGAGAGPCHQAGRRRRRPAAPTAPR